MQEVVSASRRCASRRAAPHRGAGWRARDDLRDRRLKAGPGGSSNPTGTSGGCPPPPCVRPRTSDAQDRRRCAPSRFPDPRSNCRRRTRCRSVRRSPWRAEHDSFAVTGRAPSCRRRTSRTAHHGRTISSRWPNGLSARPICGAARPASASIAPAYVQVALTACGIKCPRDKRHAGSALGGRALAGLAKAATSSSGGPRRQSRAAATA